MRQLSYGNKKLELDQISVMKVNLHYYSDYESIVTRPRSARDLNLQPLDLKRMLN